MIPPASCQELNVPPPQILRLSRGVSHECRNQNTRSAFTCDLQGAQCCLFPVELVLDSALLCTPAVSALHKNILFAFGKHNEIKISVVIMRSIVNNK